jgi:hypothetical protein
MPGNVPCDARLVSLNAGRGMMAKNLDDVVAALECIVERLQSLETRLCGSLERRGLGRRHEPGELEKGFDKVVKRLDNLERTVLSMER